MPSFLHTLIQRLASGTYQYLISHHYFQTKKPLFPNFSLVFLELFQVLDHKQTVWYRWQSYRYQCLVGEKKVVQINVKSTGTGTEPCGTPLSNSAQILKLY